MNNSVRRQVLQTFKKLHRARQLVFEGDEHALKAGREKINAEYKKCKHVTDETSVKELVKFARDVEQELKASVVQAREVTPGKYEALLARMSNMQTDVYRMRQSSDANTSPRGPNY